jgi:hypothetical protein
MRHPTLLHALLLRDLCRAAGGPDQGRVRSTTMNPLPVEPAHRLAQRAADQNWLVTSLWSEEAVGIIGGEPKCCKSFLALDLAVAVAAGTLCLRRFSVPKPGRVLLYAAEDALHIVRRRLDGICATVGLSLVDLDVQVITAPTLRLDLDADRGRLDETVARLQPRLLVLDPFVRLHRIDENASGEVAPLLAYLRDLQRRHGPRRHRRASRQEGRRQHARRPGPARLVGIPRLGRLQPLSPPRQRRIYPHR